MGLYLCVFGTDECDEELDGVEVGSYEDFHELRSEIARTLERGTWSARFPVLMSHSDSHGTWSPGEAAQLRQELLDIQSELLRLPPKEFAPDSWQHAVMKRGGLRPTSLADSFIDVDGEPLLSRLVGLATVSVESGGNPIAYEQTVDSSGKAFLDTDGHGNITALTTADPASAGELACDVVYDPDGSPINPEIDTTATPANGMCQTDGTATRTTTGNAVWYRGQVRDGTNAGSS